MEDFIYKMEKDDFLAWEAVMAEEQGLPLTEKQEAALGELLDFSDGGDNRVLYIDEIPRPIEPWHVILNKIVPHILVEPFRTADAHYGVHCEGWRNLVDCLAEHGDGLSLPQGVSSSLEVVPIGLRHTLWLQDCFDTLSGLGQYEDLTLENEEQQDRIDGFIAAMREHGDSVQFFNLTLDSLLERVILPERDRPIFVKMMQEKLGHQDHDGTDCRLPGGTMAAIGEGKIGAGGATAVVRERKIGAGERKSGARASTAAVGRGKVEAGA